MTAQPEDDRQISDAEKELRAAIMAALIVNWDDLDICPTPDSVYGQDEPTSLILDGSLVTLGEQPKTVQLEHRKAYKNSGVSTYLRIGAKFYTLTDNGTKYINRKEEPVDDDGVKDILSLLDRVKWGSSADASADDAEIDYWQE